MSFSSKVKEELSKECNSPRHCCIAETAAIISMCGKVIFDEKDHVRIEIHTENVTVARKYFTLLKKTFNISTDYSERMLQTGIYPGRISGGRISQRSGEDLSF